MTFDPQADSADRATMAGWLAGDPALTEAAWRVIPKADDSRRRMIEVAPIVLRSAIGFLQTGARALWGKSEFISSATLAAELTAQVGYPQTEGAVIVAAWSLGWRVQRNGDSAQIAAP